MQTLLGQVDRILFEKEGFVIGLLKNKEKFTAHHFELDANHLIGSAITLKGEWEDHSQYGRTFKAHTLIVNQNELFFFLNKVVKGFTKKLTSDLIERYGSEELVHILEHDLSRLMEIKGMNEKRLSKLGTRWKLFRSMRALGEFLAPFGITATLLRKISTAFEGISDPIQAIKKNPYGLTRIEGIGFKKADDIAQRMGISKEDPRRIGAAMEYLLSLHCDQEGNSTIDIAFLFEKLDQLLELGDFELYKIILTEQISEGNIIYFPSKKISPKRIYEAETFLLEQFKHRSKLRQKPFFDDLSEFMREHKLHLGKEQEHALSLINEGVQFLFLVGYAGTGKSTTSKALLDLLATRIDPALIITCALSGIASQRIRERSGYNSTTLQSLLVRFEGNEHFPYKVVLIDEASMINSVLLARVLSKIDSDATLILVGDDAQLPPIGAGSPLSDALCIEWIPHVTLTHIYRQSQDQNIPLIANDIRKGVVPDYKTPSQDFKFYPVEISNRYQLKQSLLASQWEEVLQTLASNILAQLATLVLEELPHSRTYLDQKKIREYLSAFQILSPMKSNTLGVENLNHFLQQYFNPNPKKMVATSKGEFRLYDKVVHTKNDNLLSYSLEAYKNSEDPSERRIFNGMCGLLFKLEDEDEFGYVYYPNEDVVVRYPYEQFNDYLQLSYALSIHKVQGMEYETVVLLMSFSHSIMLNSKLLYTAITRARHKCLIVGESGAFEMGCRRLESTQRTTVIQELLIN